MTYHNRKPDRPSPVNIFMTETEALAWCADVPSADRLWRALDWSSGHRPLYQGRPIVIWAEGSLFAASVYVL